MKRFRGSMVALITPFRNGRVDAPALKRLIEFHVREGTQALVPCGTTGESATLSHSEHVRVIELTIAASAGRVPVLAGTGSNNTVEAIRLTRHARRAGADGALLICPYYNRPTQEGLYRHFKAVADAVDLPLVLYNIPSRTGVNLEPQTWARVCRCSNIVGVKEASANLEQMSRILEVTQGKVDLISGDDALTLPILALGGVGVISVLANVVPTQVREMIERFENQDGAGAVSCHRQVAALTRALFVETNPVPVKQALAWMGMCRPDVRLPLAPLSENGKKILRRAMKEQGLLKR